MTAEPPDDDAGGSGLSGDSVEAVEAAVVPLLEPRDGLPDLVTTPEALAETVSRLAAGSGPIALDAERASGYRYGQRAYLVQLRRQGSGTALVDPTAFPDLTPLQPVLAEAEWVLHAASQDLPCLAEAGLRPRRLFDTELAGRLLGHPRVGLAAITESVLGYALEKGYSAADWSTRPLPADWLRYAALDVEVLVELRDALHAELVAQGKLGWAEEEFGALAAALPPEPRREPWRRTSGLHRVRGARRLAAVRELWYARDELARSRDIAPGRVLPDAAIIDAASQQPASREELLALPVFGGRSIRRTADRWLAALDRARALPDRELPTLASGEDILPPARSWAERDPAAAARLAALRPAVAALADEHGLPTENLLSPDTLRRIAWEPPDPPDDDTIAEALRARGARDWQVALTAHPIARALDRLARVESVQHADDAD